MWESFSLNKYMAVSLVVIISKICDVILWIDIFTWIDCDDSIESCLFSVQQQTSINLARTILTFDMGLFLFALSIPLCCVQCRQDREFMHVVIQALQCLPCVLALMMLFMLFTKLLIAGLRGVSAVSVWLKVKIFATSYDQLPNPKWGEVISFPETLLSGQPLLLLSVYELFIIYDVIQINHEIYSKVTVFEISLRWIKIIFGSISVVLCYKDIIKTVKTNRKLSELLKDVGNDCDEVWNAMKRNKIPLWCYIYLIPILPFILFYACCADDVDDSDGDDKREAEMKDIHSKERTNIVKSEKIQMTQTNTL